MYPDTLTATDLEYENLVSSMKNTLDDYTKHGQIVKCNECSIVYVNPPEGESELVKAYGDVVDQQYLETEKFRKILLKKHLDDVTKYTAGGKVLDVGSFAGYFLDLAKEVGWETYGIEPSKWAMKHAEKRGHKNSGYDILSAKLKPNYFDLLTMWDVIEHLSKPNDVLVKVNRALKPGGILAIGTPDIESIFAKMLGSRCPFLVRMHIVFYTAKTLESALNRHGFKVLAVSYYGRTFPVSYFIDRLQGRNRVLRTVTSVIKKIPVLSDLPITLNFRDSVRVIAQKV